MSPLSLESFEAALADDDSQSSGFNEGYQQGFDAGCAAAAADQAALSAALVQSINDINFTYAEARAQVLQSLGPLFETLIAQVLPHCVENGFADQLVGALAQGAAIDTNGAICIHVHPDQQDAVEAATADLPTEIDVLADPALGLHAAWIKRDATETKLDLDRMLVQITEVLCAIANPENRITSHG